MVIPCPNETVASLHFPHLNVIGSPTSSISKSILFKTPIFSKKNLSLSISNFCPILTDAIFPDLIKISSTVKSAGILSLYSPIVCPAQLIDFGKSKNCVFISIKFSSNPAAIVNVLKPSLIHIHLL